MYNERLNSRLVALGEHEESRKNDAGNFIVPAGPDEIENMKGILRWVECSFHHKDDKHIYHKFLMLQMELTKTFDERKKK